MSIDRDLDQALDRFTVPAAGAGFADRIVAAAGARIPVPSPRRTRRGWTRGRTWLAGGLAIGLMSATAAAAGLFGDAVTRMPLIGPMIAAVTADDPAPKAVAPGRKRPAQAAADRPLVQPTIAEPRLQQNQAIADRVLQRIDRREAVRNARGLPPRHPRMAQKIEAFRAATPDERAVIVENARGRLEARRETIRSGEAAPLTRTERRALRAWRMEQRRLRAGQAGAGEIRPMDEPTNELIPQN